MSNTPETTESLVNAAKARFKETGVGCRDYTSQVNRTLESSPTLCTRDNSTSGIPPGTSKAFLSAPECPISAIVEQTTFPGFCVPPRPPLKALLENRSLMTWESSINFMEGKKVDESKVGQKFDGAKMPVVQGFLQYFPRAVEAVTGVSVYGTVKYNNGKFPTTWKQVPDGIIRYTNALGRHLLAEFMGQARCPESGLQHAAQAAWNAMARLELMLIEEEKTKPNA